MNEDRLDRAFDIARNIGLVVSCVMLSPILIIIGIPVGLGWLWTFVQDWRKAA